MARKTTNKAMDQTFSFNAPAAMSVQLVGDFTHWQKSPISLQQVEGGVWRTKVNLPPGTYHSRFLVDGQWRDDPECPIRVTNPSGSQDSVRHVG